MFERFTKAARDVVVHAQQEALDLRHDHIGTEHLLLALLRPEAGLSHAVLASAGVRAEQVRAAVQQHASSQPLGEDDAAALRTIGIDLPTVLDRLTRTFGPDALAPRPARRRGMLRRRVGGHVPFTSRAKKVMELALREAVALGHHHIGAEHVLLGLLREGRGRAALLLVERGQTLDGLRRATLAALERAA